MSERDCPAMKRRIDEGERRVRQMDESGRDVAAWEAFWIELLRAYKTLCAVEIAADAGGARHE